MRKTYRARYDGEAANSSPLGWAGKTKSKRPSECLQCFSRDIEVGFFYDAYECKCKECGHEWKERVGMNDSVD